MPDQKKLKEAWKQMELARMKQELQSSLLKQSAKGLENPNTGRRMGKEEVASLLGNPMLNVSQTANAMVKDKTEKSMLNKGTLRKDAAFRKGMEAFDEEKYSIAAEAESLLKVKEDSIDSMELGEGAKEQLKILNKRNFDTKIRELEFLSQYRDDVI
jgi:hypothetical protein